VRLHVRVLPVKCQNFFRYLYAIAAPRCKNKADLWLGFPGPTCFENARWLVFPGLACFNP